MPTHQSIHSTPTIHPPPPILPSPLPHPIPFHLIRSSRLLTRLQLLQIPTTDAHIPLILIHAPGETLDVGGARLVLRAAIAAAIPATRGALVLAAVETVVHGLGVGIAALLEGLLVLGGRAGGAATKEAADGVADGGADCDAAVGGSGSVSVWDGLV